LLTKQFLLVTDQGLTPRLVSMPFASIWLGLGLALTSIIGKCRLTLKTCAVPGTQQSAEEGLANPLRSFASLLAVRYLA